MRLSAREVATLAGGIVAEGDPDAVIDGFVHDSRVLGPGDCFVALRGARDGHDFVDAAFAAGAAAVLVARPPGHAVPAGRAVVRVDDPLVGLGAIAAGVRDRLDALEVVGVTGSTGKTSTKDLLVAALDRARVVHASRESFNNEVGLPLTVLGADAATDVLVTEMGARFAGNIAALCRIARPTIGVVTNVGLAHAEHLGGPEGIVSAKGELLESLPVDGLAVVSADDPASAALAARTRARVVRVGRAADAEARITSAELDAELRPYLCLETPYGALSGRIGLRGAHQVANAAMAATVALAVGVAPEEVAAGLAAASGSRWRMQLERSPAGVTVLNDAYNANPDSMRSALRSLAHLEPAGRRIAVVGEMRELGDHGAEAHRSVGELASALGIDVLVGVGQGGAAVAAAAPRCTTVEVADAAAALHAVVERVRPGDAVLVKASRAVGLEAVAEGLVAGAGDHGEPDRRTGSGAA